MKQILFSILCLMVFNTYAQEARTLSIDMSMEKGAHAKTFRNCVGAGRANEGLRADWQNQLREAKKECGFNYIRFHGLLHDDMGVYKVTRHGDDKYSWDYIDKLYDFLLEIGMKPFVELSFMPDALKSGDQTIFWWKGNVTPPNSYPKYEQLIRMLVEHLVERYGHDEVASWYFEVWNEPNHPSFFSGTKEDYFKMYETAARAVKSVSQDFRVGGPASSGGNWVKDIIEHCDSNNIPLDFIATHVYGVNGFLDEFGTKQLKMVSDPNKIVNLVARTRGTINELKGEDMEMHITEWSSSYSPHDPVHDTYQNAAYVLNTLKQTENNVSSMSYWTFTDIFEEKGVPFGPFHGGFGLMNLQDLKKPTWFVYKYLNQLGDTELQNQDKSSWICKSGDNVQALFWDFSFTNQQDLSNQVLYKKHLPTKFKQKVKIDINNLKNGSYALELHQTGYLHNDIYTAYFKMGSPANLSKQQAEMLKTECSDAPVQLEVVNVENGSFQLELDINENDVYFLKLNRL